MLLRPARASRNGSPPRLWGARVPAHGAVDGDRFTPTPVGSAESILVLCAVTAVHPHACGERPVREICFSGNNGSPPRLWGVQRVVTH